MVRLSSKDSLLLYRDEAWIPFKLGQIIKLDVEVNQKSSFGMKLEKYCSQMESAQAKLLSSLDDIIKLQSTFTGILPRDGVIASNSQINFKVIIIFVFTALLFN